MAAKPTKRKGETSTTVSVGIRIDPKIKFALDMMGRMQKRSLTAVIEWAIQNALTRTNGRYENETFAELVDKVWSTDEPTRFANMAFFMPDALTYDELRIWETIKASPEFWIVGEDRPFEYHPESLNQKALRSNWLLLLDHIEKYKAEPTIKPFDLKGIIPI